MAEQVFISYRREGGEIMAQLLHDRLIQKGFSVFYDIESLRSGPFNEKLYKEIEECTDFVLVLPNGALDRCIYKEDWVRKEIAHALKCKKNIIPVMLRGFSFPPHLPDEIDDVRWQNGVSIETMEFFNSKVDKIVDMFQSDRADFHGKWNFDDELNYELSDLNKTTGPSVFTEDRLSVRIRKRYIERLGNGTDEPPKNPCPQKMGTWFSLNCSPDEQCMVLAVKYAANLENRCFEPYLEQLPHTSCKNNDGSINQTFFVESPPNLHIPIDTRMVVLNWIPSHHVLLVNNAVLSKEDSKVLVAKDPIIFHTGDVYSVDEISQQIGLNCNIATSDQPQENTLVADPKEKACVVDLENWSVVKRNAFYDPVLKVWNATINLIPNKLYFVLHLDTTATPILSDELLGLGYWHGLFGLSKDVFKAIDVLENRNSPLSLYLLSQLFHYDDILGDESDYLHYLSLAANAGHEDAILRLANLLIDGQLCDQDYTEARIWLEKLVGINPSNPSVLNNLGWLYKNGKGCTQDYLRATEFFTASIECGGTTAYKHIADIVLLSHEEILDRYTGLKYLLIAEQFGVGGTEKLFKQFQELWDNSNEFDQQVSSYRDSINKIDFSTTPSVSSIDPMNGEDILLTGGSFRITR